MVPFLWVGGVASAGGRNSLGLSPRRPSSRLLARPNGGRGLHLVGPGDAVSAAAGAPRRAGRAALAVGGGWFSVPRCRSGEADAAITAGRSRFIPLLKVDLGRLAFTETVDAGVLWPMAIALYRDGRALRTVVRRLFMAIHDGSAKPCVLSARWNARITFWSSTTTRDSHLLAEYLTRNGLRVRFGDGREWPAPERTRRPHRARPDAARRPCAVRDRAQVQPGRDATARGDGSTASSASRWARLSREAVQSASCSADQDVLGARVRCGCAVGGETGRFAADPGSRHAQPGPTGGRRWRTSSGLKLLDHRIACSTAASSPTSRSAGRRRRSTAASTCS